MRLALLRAASAVFGRQRRPAAGSARLLLIRPDHVGDVLLTSPAVQRLAEAVPGRHTYLVGPWSAEVARHGPLADGVRTLPFPAFTRQRKRNALEPYRLLWREARRLRAEGYTAAVIFRPDDWWSALLALAAGIPVRVGYRVPETAPLLSRALPVDERQHAAERALALAEAMPRELGMAVPEHVAVSPVFTITADEQAEADRFFQAHELAGKTVVAIHPSAGAPLKSWPVERWAAVADALRARGAAVLLSGGPGDEGLLGQLRERMAQPPDGVVVGQPLGVAAAIFARCALVLGPDSGALHLAAAVGTPTVRLYGPAAASSFGPWPPGPTQRVLVTDTLACVPCGHLEHPPCGARTLPPCLRALAVEDVVAEAQGVLGAKP